jgi:hypothetical protein
MKKKPKNPINSRVLLQYANTIDAHEKRTGLKTEASTIFYLTASYIQSLEDKLKHYENIKKQTD